jgi:hypothetical protein
VIIIVSVSTLNKHQQHHSLTKGRKITIVHKLEPTMAGRDRIAFVINCRFFRMLLMGSMDLLHNNYCIIDD